MNDNTKCDPAANFVPAEFDAGNWHNLEPMYKALLDRELADESRLEQLLLDRSELDAAVSETQANRYINMTCHTDDEELKRAYLDFVENVQPQVKRISFEIDRKIASSPHAAKLDHDRYEVLLRGVRTDVELFRDENVPLQTDDIKLSQRYEEACGAMMVEFRGEHLTLPMMMRFMEDTDRKTREDAWRGMADRRLKDADRFDDIFDEMVKIRHRIARNAGFDNYMEYIFRAKHRFDYTPADCQAFHRAAEEVCVPLYRKLNEERAEALDVDPLRPWDLAVDIHGRAPLRPFQTAGDLIERTSRLYHCMDSSLGELFDRLRTGDCLDLETRKGKAPGGYQYHRDRSRRPFIFMNAAGLQRDLETMVHEAGHAFHSMLCDHDPLLAYRHAPIEFAEVASMSMESLSYPYLGEFYDEADAARAKRAHLEQLAKMLPWIATIDAFQHWIYTNPKHKGRERAAYWLELDDRFGPAVSWEGLEKHRRAGWQRQLHLFSVPFYYIEYGIAQLGALGIWLQSKTDEKQAIANYRKALALGGSRPLPELFAAAGLEFDFGPETIKRLMDAVQEELATLPL